MFNILVHFMRNSDSAFCHIYFYFNCVFVLFIVLHVASGKQCPQYTCATLGYACGDGDHPVGCVGNNTYCSFGRCARLPGNGSRCTSACAPGFACNNFTCVATAAPGEPCTTNSSCSLFNGTTILHECVDGFCLYVPDGSSCGYGVRQCKNESYCNSGTSTCTPKANYGEGCSLSMVSADCNGVCTPTDAHDKDSGVCVSPFSVSAGLPCVSGACEYGLFCSQGSPQSNGLCTPVVNTSTLYTECESDFQCNTANSERCTCVHMFTYSVCVPSAYPEIYTNVSVTFENCLIENNCSSSDFICVSHFCIDYYCAKYEIEAYNTPSTSDDCTNPMLTQFCSLPIHTTTSSSYYSTTYFSTIGSNDFPTDLPHPSTTGHKSNSGSLVIGIAISPSFFIVILALLLCGPCLLFQKVRRNLQARGTNVVKVVHEKSRDVGIVIGKYLHHNREL